MSQTDDQMIEQIKKRRTFAIISHPDAGQTTLTEKFLLYGGALNLAGTVKGRKAAKHAVSASTFWIRRAIRISQRILTVPLWRLIPRSW